MSESNVHSKKETPLEDVILTRLMRLNATVNGLVFGIIFGLIIFLSAIISIWIITREEIFKHQTEKTLFTDFIDEILSIFMINETSVSNLFNEKQAEYKEELQEQQRMHIIEMREHVGTITTKINTAIESLQRQPIQTKNARIQAFSVTKQKKQDSRDFPL